MNWTNYGMLHQTYKKLEVPRINKEGIGVIDNYILCDVRYKDPKFKGEYVGLFKLSKDGEKKTFIGNVRVTDKVSKEKAEKILISKIDRHE